MITKTYYDMPYPSALPTTMDGVKEYTDTLVAWLAEKMGLVVRTDLNVMQPDYAANTYVTFLAKNAQSAPCLAVYKTNSTYSASDLMWKCYAISPVTKVNNTYRPIKVFDSYNASENAFYRSGSNIGLNINNLGVSFKFGLVCIDFGDGRKLFCTRSTNVSLGTLVSRSSESCIFFTPINMDGHVVDSCIVIAAGINSSWIEEYDRMASNTEVTQLPVYSSIQNGWTACHGLVFSTNIGKEFITDYDIALSNDAYVSNICNYSDYQKQLYTGNVIMIDDKKYAVATISDGYSSVLLIPEEVN